MPNNYFPNDPPSAASPFGDAQVVDVGHIPVGGYGAVPGASAYRNPAPIPGGMAGGYAGGFDFTPPWERGRQQDPLAGDPNIISHDQARQLAQQRLGAGPGYTSPTAAGANQNLRNAQLGSLGRRDQIDQDQIAAAERLGGFATDRAGVEAWRAEGKSAIEAERARERAELEAQYKPRLEAAQNASNAAMMRYESLTPEQLFSDASAGKKLAILVGMGLGAAADITSGQPGMNNSLSMAKLMISNGMQAEKAELAKKFQAAKLTEQEAQNALVRLNHKYEAQLGYMNRIADAKLAQMAPGEARARAEKEAADLRGKLEDARLSRMESVEKLVQADLMRESQEERAQAQLAARKPRGGGAAGGGGPKLKEATQGEIQAITKAEQGIKSADQLIEFIRKNPQAYDEFQKNRIDWLRKETASKGMAGAFRSGAQMLGVKGLGDVAEDQGLRTPGAREILKAMNALQTSVARAYGGSMTEDDAKRSAAEIGTTASPANEMIAFLENKRNTLTSERDLILSNRRVNMPTSSTSVPITPGNAVPQGIKPAPGAAAPAASGGIPSGAVMGTYKGVRGYRVGNQFYPLGN